MVVLREFEYEDHPSDIKVVAYGNTPKRVIEALMLGILNIIYDINKVENKAQKEINFEAEDIIEVIFKLGNTLLDIFYIDKFAIGDIRVKNLRRIKKNNEKIWSVCVKIFGEDYDIKKHEFKKEVKAVTYNELSIKRVRKAYWIATAVVDV